jgi:hypothetical protein
VEDEKIKNRTEAPFPVCAFAVNALPAFSVTQQLAGALSRKAFPALAAFAFLIFLRSTLRDKRWTMKKSENRIEAPVPVAPLR